MSADQIKQTPDADQERAFWSWIQSHGFNPRAWTNPKPWTEDQIEAELERLKEENSDSR